MDRNILSDKQFDEMLLLRYETLMTELNQLIVYMQSRGLDVNESKSSVNAKNKNGVDPSHVMETDSLKVSNLKDSERSNSHSRVKAIRIPEEYSSDLTWKEKFLFCLYKYKEITANEIGDKIKEEFNGEQDLETIRLRMRTAGSALNKKGYLNARPKDNKFLYSIKEDKIEELLEQEE